MPGLDGLGVLKRIRSEGAKVPKEYQLMELFLSHPHRIFSSEYIMDNIWGQDSYSCMDIVWTYIGFVRKKLRAVRADVEIRTVRGSGYTLEERNVCKQQKATV